MSKHLCMSMGCAVAALTMVIASLSLVSAVEAKGGGGGKGSGPSMPMQMHASSMKSMPSSGPKHHWRYGYGPVVVVAPSTSCGDYLAMWRRTGSSYWRTKYYLCIG